jgi:hypothetical protein
MSAAEGDLIAELLTPDAEARVSAALAAQGLGVFDRGLFTGVTSWTTMFGSTTGPFHGIGGAAMTSFLLTVVYSPAAMILFARNQRYGPPRLFGVAAYAESVLERRDWTTFTAVAAS